MKVIVTGGSGRLGRYLIKELLEHRFDVLCIDAAEPPMNLCQSIAADLTRAEELNGIFERADAVVHLARKRFPYTENGFDPSTRTWKTPDISADAQRFNDNVAITYNVLSAATAAGVEKIVCGSSLAVYGLYYPSTNVSPDYLPIDEDHPRRPQDPYGLSKLVGEKMCDSFCRKANVRIASLRFSGIYTETNWHVLDERKKDPTIRGTGALWSYVDARDAATACRLALQADFQDHQAFNICAPTTIMDVQTEELVRRYLPQVEGFKRGLQGNWCGYDTRKAAAMLDFRARHLFHDG
ncbi:MAG: NAD-dependent epimerase/dehydratase family protein, partial [Candidatus Binatia bacterium]